MLQDGQSQQYSTVPTKFVQMHVFKATAENSGLPGLLFVLIHQKKPVMHAIFNIIFFGEFY